MPVLHACFKKLAKFERKNKHTYMSIEHLFDQSITLLKKLIQTPSLSGKEDMAATHIFQFMHESGIHPYRELNNVWSKNKHWQDGKPVVLLNSHIDTVKPVTGWTYDPFGATVEGDRLIGLGSNDAGASLVSLLAVFRYFYEAESLPFNLIYAATAEEESSGENGVALMVDLLGHVDFALVGEPTSMDLAIAEKGLVVLDCYVRGKAGHAARNEGVNAIYLAVDEINKLRNHRFEKISGLLGEVKITVTQVEAGFQHNVVPDLCKFVVDCRTNECYSNKEIADMVSELLDCEVVPRSLRLNSSGIDLGHPFVARARTLGVRCYGSPTLSDQSLMPYVSVKMGPGDSARSHTADEYILISEIYSGIERYIDMIDGLQL
jgi:acetylornithine deacetylase